MPIDCTLSLKQHDKTNIVGIIEEGHLEGNDLVVEGYLLEKNQPEDVATIRRLKDQLGMSYEVSNVGVDDMTAMIWTLNHLTFTGAAILRKDAAAYAKTAIAAQAEEDILMPAVDTILEELRLLRRGVGDIAAARQDDADEEASRAEEDAAHQAETDAAKAWEDEDAQEAARYGTLAGEKRLAAAQRREAAAARHRQEATAQTAAGNEEGAASHLAAATHHEAEATRLREEDATLKAAATQRMAAGRGVPAIMKELLEAMGDGGQSAAAKPVDDDDMTKMLGMFLRAMVYPAGISGAQKAAAVPHDDEKEDTALFRRLIKQYKDKAAMDAAGNDDLAARRTDRRLVKIEAAMGLITDTLKQQTGLITDLVHAARNLTTDAARPGQGGPVRRSLAATGTERWVTQLEGGGTAQGEMGTQQTVAQIDAALQAEGVDIRTQIARKIELAAAGLIKDA